MKSFRKRRVGYEIKVSAKMLCISLAQEAELTKKSGAVNSGYNSYDSEAIYRTESQELPAFITAEEFATLKSVCEVRGAPLYAKELADEAKYEEECKIRDAKEAAAALARAEAIDKKYTLPAPLKVSDLLRPKYNAKNALSYDSEIVKTLNECSSGGGSQSIVVRYTEQFGWCAPTLRIANASCRTRHTGGTSRDYAVRIGGGNYRGSSYDQPAVGSTVRIGNGPHVLCTIEVYFTKTNAERLMPILELMRGGAIKANEIRDRISTRRANSRARRWGF